VIQLTETVNRSMAILGEADGRLFDFRPFMGLNETDALHYESALLEASGILE